MNAPAEEHVLVVPTMLFHEVGYFQGFCDRTEPYLKTLLDPAHTSYRPRSEMENDPSYKQLIPYCLFCCNGQVFYYRRGGSGGEGRLHKLRSVGVGGHVSAEDGTAASGTNSPGSGANPAYLEGMRREIAEEVHCESVAAERLLGLINDDETDVGRVHLGIVHVFELDEPKVRPRELSIQEAGFADPAHLIDNRDDFETWSQICLDYLVNSCPQGS